VTTNPASLHPRRTALYVPATNARALEKAPSLEADWIIVDLEDSVDAAAKESARSRAVDTVNSPGFSDLRTVVRINDPLTDWHDDDLAAVVASRASAVLVPKVNTAEQVAEIVTKISQSAPTSPLELWVMVETPAAFTQVNAIAHASEKLTTLVVGTNDLLSDLRARRVPDRLPVLMALSSAILAARAAGKFVLDGVYNNVRDLEGFQGEVAQGRILGFDGKTVVHPQQVAVVNREFSPTQEELARAQRLVEAFEEAASQGRAIAVLDGEMIETMHVAEARRILAMA
jgi:citrate lyase subunit beta/citryl-CoA lyase